MILVIGASGSVGGAVLNAVLKRGKPVTAGYRNPDDAKSASAGAKTVIADFSDKASLRRALADVDAMFLVCSPIPQLVELESNVIDVARETGVRHIVLNSSAGAGRWNKSFPKWHGEAEQKLTQSGVPFSILRPNSFMENILAFYAPTIRSQDAFYAAMRDSRMSFVAVEDIAECAASLLESKAEKRTYEINGPEAVTYDELAAKISRVSGRPVRYVDVSTGELKKSLLSTGMPEWQADALVELQEYFLTGGAGELTPDVQQLTGRPPKMLDAFLSENAAAFRKQAATA